MSWVRASIAYSAFGVRIFSRYGRASSGEEAEWLSGDERSRWTGLCYSRWAADGSVKSGPSPRWTPQYPTRLGTLHKAGDSLKVELALLLPVGSCLIRARNENGVWRDWSSFCFTAFSLGWIPLQRSPFAIWRSDTSANTTTNPVCKCAGPLLFSFPLFYDRHASRKTGLPGACVLFRAGAARRLFIRCLLSRHQKIDTNTRPWLITSPSSSRYSIPAPR